MSERHPVAEADAVTGARNGRVRFGSFELDLAAGELRKSGLKIRIQGQPLEILALLLERPGEVVTREELQRKLWPSDTIVDFEHGLNKAINRLREALADSSENPRFVETLPRHGYRFIGEVNQLARAPFQASVVTPEEKKRARTAWRRLGIPLFWVIAVALAVLLAFDIGGVRKRLFGRSDIPRIQSLAVLPLANLSGDPQQEYFSDGITEELITDLAKIRSLRVISRSSVMQYRDSKKPLPQIAKELDVDAVLEGSVQREGNHVRITAQLIQASTDRHLWAETYDRDLRDILTLESDIAAAIGSEVQAELTSSDKRRLESARPVNPDAYQANLMARYFLAKWTGEGTRKCVEYSQHAIDLDPGYAVGYASLASCYAWAGLGGDQSAFPKAKAAAEKAMQLDDTLAEAHAVSGQVKVISDWDWLGAEKELKRAVDLDPSSSDAHIQYGFFLTAVGRSEEAVRETEKGLKLDPLTPTTNIQLGWVLYYARRYDESIAQLDKALEMDPNLGIAHWELSWNYAQKRMYPEAISECRGLLSIGPQDQAVLGTCGGIYGLAGRRQDALLLLSRLQKLSAKGYLDPYNVAWVYDGLGDNDRTMEWLTRAYREHSVLLWGVRIEQWTQKLRSDPRFQELLRQMNFPPQTSQ